MPHLLTCDLIANRNHFQDSEEKGFGEVAEGKEDDLEIFVVGSVFAEVFPVLVLDKAISSPDH
jgi:hypothetical protein